VTAGEWNLDGRVYALESASGEVAWDARRWPITDFLPYNEVLFNGRIEQPASKYRFPVGDLRLRFGVEPAPEASASTATVGLRVRQLDFIVSLGADDASVRMKPAGAEADWRVLAEAGGVSLPSGRVTNVEVWHADQAITVIVDGETIIRQAPYDLSPRERIELVTGEPLSSFTPRRTAPLPDGLASPDRYRRFGVPQLTLTIAGGPALLHRVALDKDIFYRPYMPNGPAFGAHPENLAILGDNEYFVLGDNSAASLDSRGWDLDDLDPWVEQNMIEWARAAGLDDDVRPGVVPRKLMLGKAFFVYWPATHRPFNLYVPDVGRMRLIY
jgi:hypothetical protein